MIYTHVKFLSNLRLGTVCQKPCQIMSSDVCVPVWIIQRLLFHSDINHLEVRCGQAGTFCYHQQLTHLYLNLLPFRNSPSLYFFTQTTSRVQYHINNVKLKSYWHLNLRDWILREKCILYHLSSSIHLFNNFPKALEQYHQSSSRVCVKEQDRSDLSVTIRNTVHSGVQ